MTQLTLHRLYLPDATHGLLQLDGQNISLTIELPWLNNQAYISCIPEGTYPLVHRHNERFKSHIEIRKVPHRHLILFHPANNVKYDLKGCIAPVSQIATSLWGNRSRLAMQKLLDAIEPHLIEGQIELIIKEASSDAIVQQIKKRKL